MIRSLLFAILLVPCALSAQNDTQAPQLITLPVSGITATSAISGGDILSDGGNFIFNRGIVWDLDTGATILTNLGMVASGQGIGQYSGTMTNLVPETQYYVRAFAQDLAGDFYGSDISFVTAAASLNEANNIWLFIGPNPTSDFVQLRWEAKDDIKRIALYDVTGKLIFEDFPEGLTEKKWDLSGLAAGNYILRWNNDEVQGSGRIIKR
jgi:hypothetical protein